MPTLPEGQTALAAIRAAVLGDETQILAIGNTLFPEDYQETLKQFRYHRKRLRAGGYADVFAVAETPGGQVVGYAHHQQMPGQADPDRFRVIVGVAPEWRGRGVGRALFAHVTAQLIGRGARAAETFAREHDMRVIDFLVRRGFREAMRAWENRLDPSRFDPAPFAPYLERVAAAGITITTLTDEQDRDPDALSKAYELHNAVEADIPSTSPFEAQPFERYVEHNVRGPNALLDAYFLAKAGEAYVGEAVLRTSALGTYLTHDTTGVRRAYRGRGIAMALKLATIEYARAHGHTQIRTWNEVNNAGMLAINEQLGFVRRPAWITFEKTLAAGSR